MTRSALIDLRRWAFGEARAILAAQATSGHGAAPSAQQVQQLAGELVRWAREPDPTRPPR